MKRTSRTIINWTKLIVAFVLLCSVFGFSLTAQTNDPQPMTDKARTALIEELKGVVAKSTPDEKEAAAVSERWDKRTDLKGKTKQEVIKLLFEDVRAVIKDSGTQYELYSMFSFYKQIPDESFSAQTQKTNGASTPGPATTTDIRKFDFLNFTYRSSLCSQEYGRNGIGKIVRVRDGEFKNKNVYFAVTDNQIIYADVTGDGSEDAIVPVNCGAATANFALSEIYLYTIKDGRAALLAEINDHELERDYRRSFPDAESYWGVNENGLKVKDGHLEIEVLADGPHASPQYLVTLEYRLSGKTPRLIGKPQRRSFSE